MHSDTLTIVHPSIDQEKMYYTDCLLVVYHYGKIDLYVTVIDSCD